MHSFYKIGHFIYLVIADPELLIHLSQDLLQFSKIVHELLTGVAVGKRHFDIFALVLNLVEFFEHLINVLFEQFVEKDHLTLNLVQVHFADLVVAFVNINETLVGPVLGLDFHDHLLLFLYLIFNLSDFVVSLPSDGYFLGVQLAQHP